MKIACCQSCKYGNYCPYGDQDNEIFCLKEVIVNDKMDVCNYITKNKRDFSARSKELLFYCDDYEEMADGYYTYNDWDSRLE